MNTIIAIAVIIIAYLLGTFPSGYVIGWVLGGVDIRKYGSKRTGTTNVLRTVGLHAAAITIVMDILKSAIAVFIARGMGLSPTVQSLAALAALLGHVYPVFLGFKGGAGVGTAIGFFGAVNIPVGLTIAVIGIVVMGIWKYVSLGSLTMLTLMPISIAICAYFGLMPWEYLIFGVGAMAIVYWAHRPNIQRLLSGTERRIGEKVDIKEDAGDGAEAEAEEDR